MNMTSGIVRLTIDDFFHDGNDHDYEMPAEMKGAEVMPLPS